MEMRRRVGRVGVVPCMLCSEGRCSQACVQVCPAFAIVSSGRLKR